MRTGVSIATRKFPIQLLAVVMETAAPRTSSGNISLVTTQAIGLCTCIIRVHRKHRQCHKVYTVEPLNKGHLGSVVFVLYWEDVLWWEVRITIVSTTVMSIGAIASVLYTEVVLWWEGPL